MGYFSNLASEDKPCHQDHSYLPYEKHLLLRLEELEDRLEELTHQKTGSWDGGEYFSESDLRYALPEHITSAANVRRAMDLAVSELADRYGIYVGDQPEEPEFDELTGMQISILDMLALQSCRQVA